MIKVEKDISADTREEHQDDPKWTAGKLAVGADPSSWSEEQLNRVIERLLKHELQYDASTLYRSKGGDVTEVTGGKYIYDKKRKCLMINPDYTPGQRGEKFQAKLAFLEKQYGRKLSSEEIAEHKKQGLL